MQKGRREEEINAIPGQSESMQKMPTKKQENSESMELSK